MSKLRFTDADKWRDPWFQQLSLLHKALWQYLVDNCDNAGVWVCNKREAEFHIGERIDWDAALAVFGERIAALCDGRKWHIVKFVQFQYPGGLSEKSAPHRQVMRLCESHGFPVSFKLASPPPPQSSLPSALPCSAKDKDTGEGEDREQKGSPEGGSPPEQTKADRVKIFRALLVKLMVANGANAEKKWQALAQGIPRATTFELKCEAIEWAVLCARERGMTVDYASQVIAIAREWEPRARKASA